MKKLPLGIQNFREIIEGDYLYIDKTEYIYNLINGVKYYFLSRPRRFGKSLLLDTIGEVFKGERELFRGLWIYDSGYDFKKHPVIRLDMSNVSNKTPEILEEAILQELRKQAQAEELVIPDTIPSTMFKQLIEKLYGKHGERVVVLIDEYDKPLLDHLTDIKTAEANRQVIRGFYGVLKSMDPNLRFTMLTGVSKFARTSLFSELNNLLDITLMEAYANICGITVEDFDSHFADYVEGLSSVKSMQHYGNIRDQILVWYDGYSWDGKTKVLNPFSLLSFFMQQRFGGFWYASGSPKFVVDLIEKDPEAYINVGSVRITESVLDAANLDKLMVAPLLFQTGYLTVKEIIPTMRSPIYQLVMPNFEVREAFNQHVLAALTDSDDMRTQQVQADMEKALADGDLHRIRDILRRLFASIPYQLHVSNEAFYHSIFYAVMSVLGFKIDAEVSVSKGRIDAVLELAEKVYVIEFKYEKCEPDASEEEKQKLFDKALEEGMAQIKDRGYHKKYTSSGKTIHLAAFAFLGRDEIEMRHETI